MYEEQLPRELAVVVGGVGLPFILTGEFKRVAGTLLNPDLARGATDGGRELLGRRSGRSRARANRNRRGNGRSRATAAAAAAAATGVAAAAALVMAALLELALQLAAKAREEL